MYKLAWKYWNYLGSDPHNHRASLLLVHLEHYVNGAIMQTARLERSRKSINKRLQEEMDSAKIAKHAYKSRKQDFSLTRLYCDYHFYFTCIGQINKLLKRLYEVSYVGNIERIIIRTVQGEKDPEFELNVSLARE